MIPSTLRAPALALALSIAAAGPGAARPAIPTLTTDEVRPGQIAVVRTVFEGARVDTFGAVILGVLRAGGTDGDMIVARALSERVVRDGVAQGMSGSPVYVDGRLIGALSSGWQFARQPIFGITPIQEMLHVLDLPEAPPAATSSGPGGVEVPAAVRDVSFRGMRWEEPDATPPEQAPPPSGRPTRLALPLMCWGLAPEALETLAHEVAPLGFVAVPGGRAAGGGPPADSLVPGAAVAVDLMRGDLQLSAIGTVTYREGDRVLLFGHPFFQAGDVSLPMSTAEIVTIVPSQASSFKLGVRGRPAGVVLQDRRSAVAGRLGGSARLMPLSVRVSGPRRPAKTFHFECIEDRLMAPSLVGAAVSSSALEIGGAGGGQTVRWTLRAYRRGHAPLVLSDVASGDAPATEFAGGVAAPLRFLFNNPFDRLVLDSVAVEATVAPRREQWTLRSARLLDAAVRPGGTARLSVELEPWHGAVERRTVEVRVPEEAPDGRYVLYLGGATEYTRYEADRLPARYRPTSLEDAWTRLQSTRSSDGLYLALIARAPEVTSDGYDYPDLPLSALAVLASGQSAGERGRRGDADLLDTQRIATEGTLRGQLLLNLNVDRKAP